MSWKTKPSDRFVLKWTKVYLSAPLSNLVVRLFPGVRPASLTILAACTGTGGGVAFGMGVAWLGGLLAAAAQVLDGMDGQLARLTGRESSRGALLDSVLDRYMDFALLFGILVHTLRFSGGLELGSFVLTPAWIVLLAGLGAAGASQVSYVTARALSLKLPYRRPELAGKGTRTTVIVLSGLLSPLSIHLPLVALVYLAIHPNIAVIRSLTRLR